jgi:GNAT superfamily N-acetyltransferase
VSGENTGVLKFRITVLPELRRRGIGRHLLGLITEVAQREGHRYMMCNTSGRVPAGAAFMRLVGADAGLESHVHQLKLSELRLDILRQWLMEARGLAREFELLFWSGAYPEEHIADIAALYDVTNHQPHGNLALNHVRFTPAHVRAIEQTTFANGAQRWSIYLRERAGSAFAGFTEVYWHPNRPALVQQGFTGVFPQYRRRGLGRWLKAAMLSTVVARRPEVTHARTGNADANAAMLHINQEIGFKPYASQCVWQAETTRVAAYLAARS